MTNTKDDTDRRIPTEGDFPMGIPVQQIAEIEDESGTPVGGVEYVANHPFPHFWISHQGAGQTWVYVAIDRDDSSMRSHDSWEAFLNSDRNPVGEPVELGEIVVQHLPEDGGMETEARYQIDGQAVVETGETAEELAIRLLHEMAGEEPDDDSETNDHIEAVRSLGQAVVELAEIDVPELEMADDMIVESPSGDEWIELEQDDDWWDAWCDIFAIVEEHIGGAKAGDNQIRPDIKPHQQYDNVVAKSDWTSLSVDVYATGSVRILAEYDGGDESSWNVMYDGRPEVSPPDPISIGGTVASAELAAIATEMGSAAKTLDYWQTRRTDGWYRQTEWKDVRGKSKQTVGDNVRATREQIEGDE